MLYAIVRSGQCALSRMGSEMPGSTDVESRVKQAKRWLDSKYSDYESFFLPHIYPLLQGLANNGPLLFAIDGSEVGKNCMALMVSVVWGKRALPVCWLVKRGKKGHMSEQLHLEVVKQLANILPSNAEVVLLGDGRPPLGLQGAIYKVFVRDKAASTRLEPPKPARSPPRMVPHFL